MKTFLEYLVEGNSPKELRIKIKYHTVASRDAENLAYARGANTKKQQRRADQHAHAVRVATKLLNAPPPIRHPRMRNPLHVPKGC